MFAIAEALVATAVGLAVAIPAVVMYNVFQRQAKSILANTDALTRVLLAHLVASSGSSPRNAFGAALDAAPTPARGSCEDERDESEE